MCRLDVSDDDEVATDLVLVLPPDDQDGIVEAYVAKGSVPTFGVHRTPEGAKYMFPGPPYPTVQLHLPTQMWQITYMSHPSRSFSWGDPSKGSYAGNDQQEALHAAAAWLRDKVANHGW